jgi:hypothetical protein
MGREKDRYRTKKDISNVGLPLKDIFKKKNPPHLH